MDLFISYAHKNTKRVSTLAATFNRLRHNVNLDQRLTGGDVWWAQILMWIEACGVFVFALLGYPGAALITKSLRARRIAIALVIIMVLVIATPLAITSNQIYRDNAAESRAADATKAWIEDSEYRYVSVTAKDEVVTVVVVGEGALPPEEELRGELRGRLYDMKVRVEALPSQSFEFETG